MSDKNSYNDKWHNATEKISIDPETDRIISAERTLDGEYAHSQELLEVFGAAEVVEMRNDVMLSGKSLTGIDQANIRDALGENNAMTHSSDETLYGKHAKKFLIGRKTELRKKFFPARFLMRHEMSEEQIRREVRRRFSDDWSENSHKTIEQLKNMLTDIDAGLE